MAKREGDKERNNDLQNTTQKTKDGATWTSHKTGSELRCTSAVYAPLLAPVVLLLLYLTKTPTLTSQYRSELFYKMVSLVTYIFAGKSRTVYTSFHRRGRCDPFINATSTIDDCQHECTNTSDCRGLTYDKSTLHCLLHDCPGTMDTGNTNITYYKKWSTCK